MVKKQITELTNSDQAESNQGELNKLKKHREILKKKKTMLQTLQIEISKQATVNFSFDAENPGELTVQEGQQVFVVKEKGEWVSVCLIRSGKIIKGIVPSSYIEIQEYTPFVDFEKRLVEIMEMGKENDSEVARMVVLAVFVAKAEDELSVSFNQRVDHLVDKPSPKGWALVNSDLGDQGLVPESFLTPLITSHENPPPIPDLPDPEEFYSKEKPRPQKPVSTHSLRPVLHDSAPSPASANEQLQAALQKITLLQEIIKQLVQENAELKRKLSRN